MSPEGLVAQFYNTIGWKAVDGVTEDTRRYVDNRECAQEYVRNVRLRLLRYIPRGKYMLDMASGPIPHREYLEYSRGYEKRYCVDLSASALDGAREKIGDHGEYLCGSFFDLELEDGFFDCTISLFTLFHIDADRQEEAVRKMLRVTKPGGKVLIVYGNRSLVDRLVGRHRDGTPELYYHVHPRSWWKRFGDVRVHPWSSFASDDEDRIKSRNLLNLLYVLEDIVIPVRWMQYPIIELTAH